MKSHNKSISGPDLNEPFRVTAGLVIIRLDGQQSFVIPAGGGWPGLKHLPETMSAHFKPRGTLCLQGTLTESDDETGRPAALALIMAQMLTAVGRLPERLHFADSTDLQLRKNNQGTAALALGTTRETYTKLLSS